MLSIYGPRLDALGLDLRPGAHASEPAEQQSLRQAIVPFVALQGYDPKLREKLVAAAVATVGGDARAIDPAFRGTALSVAVQERGAPFITALRDALIKSTDPLFRQQAAVAIGSADTPVLADAAIAARDVSGNGLVRHAHDPHLPACATRRARTRWSRFVDKNFDSVMEKFPGFARPMVIKFFEGFCRKEDVARVEAFVRPKLAALGGGELELAQTKERIGLCVALKEAKGAEIAAVLAR